ncbi:copper resistance protein CopC [Leucobacter rhizosphaerae]|uniref:Copper resistance protein CopC n=1 Tax=Leucobacter rhizosphaerae TaxID=2932245 RepID=A0ABY4FW98_9MICO|nr:copper resistance protein CopC [Leucobacter rhizosphaerae]UOQ60542.1 copper resistance protein CopC [Leucobacter rhizosphaerae]
MSRTRTSRLTRLSAAALIAGAATFGIAAPAFAHDELINTELVAGTSDGAVEAIRLTFSNSIIPTGTEIVVTGPDGSAAADGAPVIAGADVTQPLIDDLASGDYDAAWRVVSSDGHPIEGAFAFAVATDGSAAIVEAAPAEDHAEGEEHSHADGEDADHTHADEASESSGSEGLPAGAVVAIIVAAVVAAGGAVTAAVVAQRRRAQALGGNASADPSITGTDVPEAPESTTGEDPR